VRQTDALEAAVLNESERAGGTAEVAIATADGDGCSGRGTQWVGASAQAAHAGCVMGRSVRGEPSVQTDALIISL
jgi:hypothetical protein